MLHDLEGIFRSKLVVGGRDGLVESHMVKDVESLEEEMGESCSCWMIGMDERAEKARLMDVLIGLETSCSLLELALIFKLTEEGCDSRIDGGEVNARSEVDAKRLQ